MLTTLIGSPATRLNIISQRGGWSPIRLTLPDGGDHTSSVKLAAIQWPLGWFGRPLLALGVTIIFAFALESGVALGM